MPEIRTFWDWNACRDFIELAVEHYKNAPAFIIDWLNDLYIRLDEQAGAIPLMEITNLNMLYDGESWEDNSYAANRVYKLLVALGSVKAIGLVGF